MMTDAEIMKALEYCSKQGNTSECEKCTVGNGCRSELIISALDIINRQKAEFEFAKNINHLQMEELQTANSEIERLNGLLEEWKKAGYKYADSFDSIKSAAIKEFAERLKEHSRKMQSSDFSGEFWDRAVLVSVIDNLVKEMAGDTE